MKIESVQPIPVAVPYKKAYGGSYYRRAQASFVLVRVRTDDGIEGWGEAGTLGTWGETQGLAMHLIGDVLGPTLIGMDPLNIEAALAAMDRYVRGYPFTKAAVEMALWDVAGRHLGVPVYQLLGGKCRDRIHVHGGVGLAEMDQMVSDAVELAQAGFTAIKVKVGIDIDKDVELVRRVREGIGPDRLLMVDANQGYRYKDALASLREMEAYGPLAAEQPIGADDIDGMAALTRQLSATIVADEGVCSPADALRHAAARAADLFHVYALKPGGLYNARKCIQIAEAADIPCLIGGMIDLGIGSAAELHLSAALANVRPDVVPCGIFGPWFLVDDVITQRFTMHDGAIAVPDGPGLGVEVDMDKVRHYEKRVTSDYA